MKLTKQGYSALERAILNDEGKDDSFELSPFKKAQAYEQCKEEINKIHQAQKKMGAKKYTPRILVRELNIYIKYFNQRGAEFTSLNR